MPGLPIISANAAVSQVIEETEYQGVDFIGRGRMVNNPAELFMTEKFQTLVDACSAQYDVIILDTPPILSVTDAAIIGRFASTSLMVVRFEQNSVQEVEAGLRRFTQNGIAIQGSYSTALKNALRPPIAMAITHIRSNSSLFL